MDIIQNLSKMIFAVVDFHPAVEGKHAFYDPVGIAFFIPSSSSSSIVAVTAFHTLPYGIATNDRVLFLQENDLNLPVNQAQPIVVQLASFSEEEGYNAFRKLPNRNYSF